MPKRPPNILGFTGYWASGKSLLMCAEALQRILADPKLLIGNNFNFTGSPHAVGIRTLDDVLDFCTWKTPGWRKLLLVDEIQSLIRPGANTEIPPAADVVFQQGRKLGLRIMYSAQHWRYVNVTIRRVTDRVYDCAPFLEKRITPRGELPVEWRPRYVRARVFDRPDPEVSQLPKKPDDAKWWRWDPAVASSYDTMALVENMAYLVRLQNEQMKSRPIVQVLTELTA